MGLGGSSSLQPHSHFILWFLPATFFIFIQFVKMYNKTQMIWSLSCLMLIILSFMSTADNQAHFPYVCFSESKSFPFEWAIHN